MNENQSTAGRKRRLPRRKFNRAIGILHRGVYIVGVGHEIGESGLSFSLPEAIPSGDKIVLSFQIPKGSFITVVAEIKGTAKNPNGEVNHGTQFLNMKFDAKRELRMFVSSRAEHEEYLGLYEEDNIALMGLLRGRRDAG